MMRVMMHMLLSLLTYDTVDDDDGVGEDCGNDDTNYTCHTMIAKLWRF